MNVKKRFPQAYLKWISVPTRNKRHSNIGRNAALGRCAQRLVPTAKWFFQIVHTGVAEMRKTQPSFSLGK